MRLSPPGSVPDADLACTVTAQLVRLRIAGFKSFAEPVSLDILPGLTGIVGPNGCGKSNVVEALRWAMGETSARSLRGGEMDDVIFAGTTARASRNLAEVSVTLAGALPAPFEAEAELQVTRRIERGAGSAFRANGREVRARDVQTLYADLASGARSSGMVSQGRVAALVNARPEERRQVLEEAAGISGLHARRHEAELKLRAAEQNLSRAEDLRTQMEGTREGLRKQARQAARYRNISGLVRAAEAEHLAVLHAQALAAVATAEHAHQTALQAAAAAADEVATTDAAFADAESGLPGPRDAEALARSVLERRRLEAETLAAEAARLTRAAEEAAARLQELETDLADAMRSRADADASVTRLTADWERLAQRTACLPDEIAGATACRDRAAELHGVARRNADDATGAAAAALVQTRAATDASDGAARRAALVRGQLEQVAAAHDECAAGLVGAPELAAAAAALAAAEAELSAARDACLEAETARASAAADHHAARMRCERAEAASRTAAQELAAAASRVTRLEEAVATAEASLRDQQASEIGTAQVTAAHAAADAAAGDLQACDARLEIAVQTASESHLLLAAASRLAEDARAARTRAEQRLADALARAERIEAESEVAQTAWAAAEQAGPSDADLRLAERAVLEASEAADAEKAVCQRLLGGRQQAEQALAEAMAAANAAGSDATRLAAEAAGLAASLGDETEASSLLAALEVPDGLEFAVSAALGDACEAGLDEASSSFWRALAATGGPPALPPDSQCMADLMAAPPALARALAHVAVLHDSVDGDLVQAGLAPGVVAVTRAGACWRWDGYVRKAEAPNPAAARLQQRRRLRSVRAALAQAQAAAIAAEAQRTACERDLAAAASWFENARSLAGEFEAGLRSRKAEAEDMAARAAQAAAGRAALQPVMLRLASERDQSCAALAEARAAEQSLPDPAALATGVAEAAARAAAADAGMDAARTARQAARARAAAAQEAARQVAVAAAEAAARIETAHARLARAQDDHGDALAALARTQAAVAALPDRTAAAARLEEAAAAEAAATAREAAARIRVQQAGQAVDLARRADAARRSAHAEAASRLAGLAATLARLADECRDADLLAEAAARAVQDLPDLAALAATESVTRADQEAAAAALAMAEASVAALQTEMLQAEAGQSRVLAELQAWQARLATAQARATALTARRDAALGAAQAMSAGPAELAARAARSADALTDAEANHAAAAGHLAAAEQRVRGLALAQRDAARHSAACRERLVRTEATQEAAAGALQAVLARAADRLGADAALPACDDPSDSAEERARRKFERLNRERDEMGPVNLRAELEVTELDERISALERERDELGTAIAKLRGAIGHLNREGRERLTAIFTQVDQHFRALFTRTMGGGRAHLALTGSEDPLLAGLEIYAEPPGKKLASLSLLSGGEQALTALSLIFAVFRCTPAPVCVLDEVDAPLDDANVERFCTLLDDMVRATGTRFLVVTHHQLTMSRMDRLFGVTMQERGVSRLLSVDLHRAVAMVEPALQAAE